MQNVLREPAVVNWESAIHKGLRTIDGEPLGYIAAEDSQSIFVLSSRFREYKIPKEKVVSFDGSTVIIELEYPEMNGYLV
jgi:hypothetical protein